MREWFCKCISLASRKHSINNKCPYNLYDQFWKSQNDITSVSVWARVCLFYVDISINALVMLNSQNGSYALVGLSGWTRRAYPAITPPHNTHLACACSWRDQLAEALCKHVPGPSPSEKFPSRHSASTFIMSIICQARHGAGHWEIK